MDKLQLPHAKLFYFSAELFKNSTITENEKLKMKEMVINDEPQIFELLERYQSNGNEQEFINSILALLRPNLRNQYYTQPPQQEQKKFIQPQKSVQQVQQQEQPQQQRQQQQQPTEQYDQHPPQSQPEMNANNEEIAQFIQSHPDCPDEISSPLGLKLLKRKQKQQKQNPQIKDYLKPFKINQE